MQLQSISQATVSKSRFKAKALEYMRLVEQNKQPLVVTDMGQPVIQVSPYVASGVGQTSKLYALRDTLLKYDQPTAPVSEHDWEALQ